MARIIKMEFTDGKTKVETEGFQGQGCTAVTEALLQSLQGQVDEGTLQQKPEFFDDGGGQEQNQSVNA